MAGIDAHCSMTGSSRLIQTRDALPMQDRRFWKSINSEDGKDVYYIPRRNIFMGKKIRFCGWYPNYRQPQLFRRGKLIYETKDLVHEGYQIGGSTGYLKKDITQIPFTGVSEIFYKMNRYSDLGAEKLLQ